MDFIPRSITVRGAAEKREALTDALRVGGSVLVNPDGLLPIDGAVRSDHSFVDQSRITGESVPVEKLPGSVVCREYQSIGRARDSCRADRAQYELRQDHRAVEHAERFARAGATVGGSSSFSVPTNKIPTP